MMDRALESLSRDGLPDLLTLYFAGADGIGHLRGSRAQADYLADTLDLQLGRFLDRLGELDPQWRSGTQFIITSDHGRTDAPAFPEDQHIERAMRSALELAGYAADQYRIVENGGVVHVYLSADPRTPERHCAGAVAPCVLGSRSLEALWNGTPGPEDVLAAARALSADAGLEAVVDSVAFRSHVPGPGYTVYGADADKSSPTVALLAAIDSPRSGDVLLLLKPGHYFGNTQAEGAQHGSGFAPDLSVPIAIALGGAHPGRSPAPLSTADIAKIIAAYLGLSERFSRNGSSQRSGPK
jgi:type I phosphodiesterase/nucleotide pyrophosphatase